MTFGHYETTRSLAASTLATVAAAQPGGEVSDPPVVVKFLQPSAATAVEAGTPDRVNAFLDGVRVQQQVASQSRYWAPIVEAGETSLGAYCVTPRYAQSAQRLIGRVRVSEPLLYNLVTSCLKGLLDLQRIAGRAHGNLKPSNILISDSAVVLTDPLGPTGPGPQDPMLDLRDIGGLIFSLVTHQAFDPSHPPHPIADSTWWLWLGPSGQRWRRLCNDLLDPSREMTLQALAGRIRHLHYPRPEGPLAAAALLAVAAVTAMLMGT